MSDSQNSSEEEQRVVVEKKHIERLYHEPVVFSTTDKNILVVERDHFDYSA